MVNNGKRENILKANSKIIKEMETNYRQRTHVCKKLLWKNDI